MQLEVPEYLSALNQARGQNLLDWHSTSPNTHSFGVGKITVEVMLDQRSKRWQWLLRHERSGTLTSGSSEDRDVAQQEAIAYAIHWVKNAMVGVLA